MSAVDDCIIDHEQTSMSCYAPQLNHMNMHMHMSSKRERLLALHHAAAVGRNETVKRGQCR